MMWLQAYRLRRKFEVACAEKLKDWTLVDVENPNMQVGKLELIPPDGMTIVNLTWAEIIP